ncbi:hypothetical protein EV702DRAFT_1051922, partial [Suillus placidus]
TKWKTKHVVQIVTNIDHYIFKAAQLSALDSAVHEDFTNTIDHALVALDMESSDDGSETAADVQPILSTQQRHTTEAPIVDNVATNNGTADLEDAAAATPQADVVGAAVISSSGEVLQEAANDLSIALLVIDPGVAGGPGIYVILVQPISGISGSANCFDISPVSLREPVTSQNPPLSKWSPVAVLLVLPSSDTSSPFTQPSNPPSHRPRNPVSLMSLLPINLDQQAVYRDGRNPTCWCSIGALYFQINQFRDALDAYSHAIRINPYISEVWFDLGSLYESSSPATIDVHSSPNLPASVKQLEYGHTLSDYNIQTALVVMQLMLSPMTSKSRYRVTVSWSPSLVPFKWDKIGGLKD